MRLRKPTHLRVSRETAVFGRDLHLSSYKASSAPQHPLLTTWALHRKLPFCSFLPKRYQQPGLGRAKAGNQELQPRLPHVWQRPSSLSHHCGLPRCLLTRNQSWEWQPSAWRWDMDFVRSSLATRPNTHPAAVGAPFSCHVGAGGIPLMLGSPP